MLLRQLRKKNNLTQQMLADKIGIPRSTLCMWETNRSSPPVEKILQLATVLNATTDELLKKE